MSAPAALRIEKLSLSYAGSLTVSLPQLTLREGEPALLTGVSGSGKSTLLECIGLLNRRMRCERYTVGDRELTSLDDRELERWRKAEVGFMPQSGGLVAFLSVAANLKLQIELTLEARLGTAPRAEVRRLYAEALEMAESLGVGGALLKRYPAELSIGQRQRAVFCRAVAGQPQLLLIDEPTAALDPAHAVKLFELMADLSATRHNLMLIVTHDIRHAALFKHSYAWSEQASDSTHSVFLEVEDACGS